MSDQHLNDQEMEAMLRTWLQDAPAGRPDRSRVVGTVIRQLHPIRRRRRRWWPFAVSRRQAMTPTIPPGIPGQPGPIPAAHGRTPTVIGRTRSMLSPVTAITAGALAVALGGVLLVAQPFEQRGSAPAAEGEPVAPTWVTGTISYAPLCTGPDSEQDGAVRHDWNVVCSPQGWRSENPRFTGEVSARWNEDVFQTDEGILSVSTGAYYLRNDDGGWACSTSSLVKGSGLFSEALTGDTVRCAGEGGYEGLSALLVAQDDPLQPYPAEFVGLIFSGDFPPVPDAPAAE